MRCFFTAFQDYRASVLSTAALPSPSAAILSTALSTASCIESSRLSAVISLRRSLWRPLAAAAERADSSASKSVFLRWGSTRSERAGPGVWVGTPGPVDCPHLDGHPPTAQSAASTLPEGSQHHTVPHAEEKRLSTFEIFYTHIPDIYSEGLVATA